MAEHRLPKPSQVPAQIDALALLFAQSVTRKKLRRKPDNVTEGDDS